VIEDLVLLIAAHDRAHLAVPPSLRDGAARRL